MQSLNILDFKEPERFTLPEWLKVQAIVYSARHRCNVEIQGILGDTLFIKGKKPSSLPLRESLASGLISEASIRAVQPLDTITDERFKAIAAELEESGLLNYVEVEPAVAPEYCNIPESMHPLVQQALPFPQLYSHQVKAFESLQKGMDLGLFTPTASGKTGCFIPGIMNGLLVNPKACAIFIYPMKALVNDQVKKLQEMADPINKAAGHKAIRVALITGDVPIEERLAMFSSPEPPNVLAISPDVLHHMIRNIRKVEHWAGWIHFLIRLKYVVADESHSYTGVFGGNFINLCRRLRNAINSVFAANIPASQIHEIGHLMCDARMAINPGEAEVLRSLPTHMIAERRLQWVVSSATVGNPEELALSISGRAATPSQLESIKISGSGTKGRTLLACKPSPRANQEITQVVLGCLSERMSGIVFSNYRAQTKSLWMGITKQAKKTSQGALANECIPYYGSMGAKTRCDIISGMESGKKKCILATNALEAGVDLPDLDFVLLAGYPGSIMSSRQRMGRCGRTVPGLVVFFPRAADYLDEYFAKHPQLLLHGEPETAQSNPDYPTTIGQHLCCSANEAGLPLESVSQSFGWIGEAVATKLLERGGLVRRDEVLYSTESYPHGDVNLRGGEVASIKLLDAVTGAEIEQMDSSTAASEVFKDAIYCATDPDGSGLAYYKSLELDSKKCQAILQRLPGDPGQTTQATVGTSIAPLKDLREPQIFHIEGGGELTVRLTWGRLVRTVFGYKRYETAGSNVCQNKECSEHGIPKDRGLPFCEKCKSVMHSDEKRQAIDDVKFKEPIFTGYSTSLLSLEMDNFLIQRIRGEVEREKARSMDTDGQIMHGAESLWECEPEFLALHSLSHQLKFILPIASLFSRHDINAIISTLNATIIDAEGDEEVVGSHTTAYLYDTSDGGNGATETIFEDFPSFLQKSIAFSSDCSCTFGCPLCLIDHSCPQANRGLNKMIGRSLAELVVK